MPLVAFRGEGFRHQAPGFDPLSGEGARLKGGRFNPKESFPVVYVCTTRPCAVAEFIRYTSRHPLGPEAFLPRELFKYDIALSRVLDLTDDAVLQVLGCESEDLIADDRALPQQIGIAAHALSMQAIRCQSATGSDEVIAIFVEHLGRGRLEAEAVEQWDHLSDIT